jgi:phosphatidyl-myo-inositol dimannoside synthase
LEKNSVELSRDHLLITNDLGPHVGGIEVFLLGLIEQLNKGGLPGKKLYIYTSTVKKSQLAKAAKFDQELVAKYGVEIIRDRSKILLPTFAVGRRINRFLADKEIKYVFYGATAPLALLTKRLRKKNPSIQKFLGITHGHEVWWSKLPLFSAALKLIGKEIDLLTYLGDFTKQEIQKSVGLNLPMVQLAPGVDVDSFNPERKGSTQVKELVEKYGLREKKVILCVARLVKRKGQDVLIKALPAVLQAVPNAHLLIVGVGPDQARLAKLVKANHLSQKEVTFVGRVSYQLLPDYFQLGDIFAMPCRSRFFGLEVEGLGIVFLEASASGLPTLVGNSGGAVDAVIDGETGLLVDGKDVAAVREKLIHLLKMDPTAMGSAGRKWAEEYWNWEKWANKFLASLHH